MKNSKCFIKLDLFKGFWLLPLAEESREQFSFMTPDGVFTPQRLPQGACNSASQFQARMAEIFPDLMNEQLEIWIDDIFGHCDSMESWFHLLKTILERCAKFGLKLNAAKSFIYMIIAKFCGRIFTEGGVSHDPVRIKALLEIPSPTTAQELQQFLLSTQWMSRSIPDYNKLTSELHVLFNQVVEGQSKRTSRVASKIKLTSWTDIHEKAFKATKEAIGLRTILAYPDPQMVQCVFTDASDLHCSGMVTQIPEAELNLEVEQQNHVPLGFSGHSFGHSELNWSVADKEAYGIVHTQDVGIFIYWPREALH